MPTRRASTALRIRTSGPKTEQKIGGTTVTAEAGAGFMPMKKGTTASVEAKAHAEGKQGPVNWNADAGAALRRA